MHTVLPKQLPDIVVVTSSSPAPERQPYKRAFFNTPPLGSPTEVNTPSTRDTGASDDAREDLKSQIRPTRFVSSAKDEADSSVAEHVRMLGAILKKVSPEAILAAFQIAFGSSPAVTPRKTAPVDLDTSPSPSPRLSPSFVKAEAVLVSTTQSPLSVVEARLRPLIDARLATLLNMASISHLDAHKSATRHGHATVG